MSRVTLRAAFASLLLATIAAPVGAAEGKTPIHASGTTISADGRYVVTRNLTSNVGQPVITISAAFVDLDLNGMLLSQFGGPFPVIAITGSPIRVRIHDGSLQGGTTGIDAPGQISDLVVEDLFVRTTAGPGLHLGGVGMAGLRRIHVNAASGPGILWDGSDLKVGVIEETSIREAWDGIVVGVRSEAIAIRNNRMAFLGFTGGTGRGVSVEAGYGSEIAGNIVTQTTGEGIVLLDSRGARVSGNTVSGAGTHGVRVDAGSSITVIADNLVQGTGTGHGIFVQGGFNQILRNSVNISAGGGIVFDGGGTPNFACGNTFGGNHVRLSLAGGLPACNAGTPPNYCDAAVGCNIPNTSYGDNLIPGPPPS